MDAGAMAGIDTGVITMAADEPTGSDVADQLDIMFGGQQQAPSMDAGAMAGIDTGVITSTADEPTGSDVADQLDIMFGQQQQTPSMDAGAMAGIDTGVITMAADEPAGGGITSQLDILFGRQPAPSTAAAEADTGGAPDGGDIEDRLNALFGDVAAPKPSLDFPSPMDTLIAQVQGGETKSADAAEEYFRSELFSEPDLHEAARPAAVGEMPAGLFDFGDAETMQVGKNDISEDAGSADESFSGSADTIAVEHNLSEPLTFKPNVPEEGAEIVHGEDIEDRLSELFGDSVVTDVPVETTDSGDDTIEDIVGDAFGVLSADDMTDIENLSADDVIDEEPPPSDTAAELSDGDVAAEASNSGNADSDVDPDIAAILASVDAEVDATMSGIDTNAIPPESDIVEELSTDTKVDGENDADIDAILASVDAEVDSTMSGIDTNAISQESDVVAELSSEEDVGSSNTDTDTDIDAILASVDAEVDATMSGIDTNAISQESDVVAELSNAGDVDSGNADTDIDAELSNSDDVGAVSHEHDASLKSSDADAEEAVPVIPPQPDTADAEPYRVSEDDVQEKIRQLFNSEDSGIAHIDVGADFADTALDERDAPFDLPDHVLTPTLADIYFQQGQPRLALHIYERLALKDPEDERLAAKIQEIKDVLLQFPDSEPPPPRKRVTERIQKVAAGKTAGRKKKGAELKEDRRPLAGVRIKKKDSGTPKSKRKPS